MQTEPRPRPRPRVWKGLCADAALLLVVAALGWKAVAGGAALAELDLGDEGSCLIAAARVPETGLPSVEFSPLYIVLMRAHVLLGAPAEEIPFRTWACLAVALPCCVFVLARALGAGRFAAVAVAGFIPATAFIDIWPYSPYLTACVVALGTALAARLPRPTGVAVLGLTMLVASYTRPELLYATFGVAGLAAPLAAYGLWAPARRASTVGALALYASGTAAVVAVLGSPLHPGGRLIIAFGQHYTQNRATAEGWAGVGWIEDWTHRFRDDFGDAKSVGAAFRANPDAVFWHLWRNVRRLPECLTACATPHVELTPMRLPHVHPDAPVFRPYTRGAARAAVGLALVLGLFGAARGLRRWWTGEPSALPIGALALVALVPPMLAGTVLVFPRFHYMIPVLAVAAALAAAGFRHLAPTARLGARALVALVAVLALVVPNRAHGWCVQQYLLGGTGERIAYLPTASRDAARTVRALNLRGTVRFLDLTTMHQFCAGHGHDVVNAFSAQPGAGFEEFVRANDVGVIVIDPGLVAFGPVLRNTPEARALAAGTESALFRVFPVEGHPQTRVAVRRDLLPPEVQR
jgi:hypothetical protein